MSPAAAVLTDSPGYEKLYPPGSRLDLEFRTILTILRTGRLWAKAVERMVNGETGHTRVRLETLFAIAFAGEPATATSLAQRMDVQWPALARVLDSLEEDGLIDRTDNPVDGRSRLIKLTASGWIAVEELRSCVDPARADLLSDLSDAELVKTTDLVGRIFDRLKDD
jgi:MarR family transcriptional regulator for hemolysin